MKLNKNIVDYIRTTVKVAKLVGIESIAIEKDLVRGMDENKTIVICHTDNVPELPFDGIGIGRLDIFSSRFALADGREGFTVEAEILNKENSEQVSQLSFKAKDIKVEYRCATSTKIKGPKQVKDPMKYEFSISTDAVETLIKAQGAMSVEFVTVISDKKKGMCFELVDSNNDVLSYVFNDEAVTIDTRTESEFVHRYPVKTLITLLKQDPTQTIQISEKGIIKVVVLGINVFILPSI